MNIVTFLLSLNIVTLSAATSALAVSLSLSTNISFHIVNILMSYYHFQVSYCFFLIWDLWIYASASLNYHEGALFVTNAWRPCCVTVFGVHNDSSYDTFLSCSLLLRSFSALKCVQRAAGYSFLTAADFSCIICWTSHNLNFTFFTTTQFFWVTQI
jgi:hypothetical protein